jgi:hypothetical protein
VTEEVGLYVGPNGWGLDRAVGAVMLPHHRVVCTGGERRRLEGPQREMYAGARDFDGPAAGGVQPDGEVASRGPDTAQRHLSDGLADFSRGKGGGVWVGLIYVHHVGEGQG